MTSVRKYKFDVINSGAILRSITGSITKLKNGSREEYEVKEIKKIMNKGGLVPTLTIVSRWLGPLLEIIRNQKRHKGIMFTGSPRKIAEAWLLHEFFLNWPDAKKNFEVAPVEVKISEREVFRRILARKQCEKCKKIFLAEDSKFLKNCNVCGGRLIRRKDDTHSSVLARIREYKKYTAPVIRYFKGLKKLRIVNGEQTVEKVHKDVVKTLGL